MCLTVDYSKKSVKSDYFWVIICNWWRKVRKSGYSLTKMLISLKIYTKTPNTRDFCHKNSQLKHFSSRIHRILGIFHEIFPKNREIRIIWYKITHKSNNLGRKLQKIRFFAKTGTNFHTLLLQIITCGYILAKLLKQLFFHTNPRWKYPTNQILQKYPQIIVENTENSPDSSSYTIEYKSSEKFSPIISKLAFSQVPQQLFYKQA